MLLKSFYALIWRHHQRFHIEMCHENKMETLFSHFHVTGLELSNHWQSTATSFCVGCSSLRAWQVRCNRRCNSTVHPMLHGSIWNAHSSSVNSWFAILSLKSLVEAFADEPPSADFIIGQHCRGDRCRCIDNCTNTQQVSSLHLSSLVRSNDNYEARAQITLQWKRTQSTSSKFQFI